MQPPTSPWPHVLWRDHWIEVSPGWVLARLQEGLTPATCEIIALAADQAGIPIAYLYNAARAMLAPESEAGR